MIIAYFRLNTVRKTAKNSDCVINLLNEFGTHKISN